MQSFWFVTRLTLIIGWHLLLFALFLLFLRFRLFAFTGARTLRGCRLALVLHRMITLHLKGDSLCLLLLSLTLIACLRFIRTFIHLRNIFLALLGIIILTLLLLLSVLALSAAFFVTLITATALFFTILALFV